MATPQCEAWSPRPRPATAPSRRRSRLRPAAALALALAPAVFCPSGGRLGVGVGTALAFVPARPRQSAPAPRALAARRRPSASAAAHPSTVQPPDDLFEAELIGGGGAGGDPPSGFYDLELDGSDWGTDAEADAEAVGRPSASASASASAPAPAPPSLLADAGEWEAYARDEDELMTEREDRLYMDEEGNAVQVETCVLVGVEDLSAKRRYDRRGALSLTTGSPGEEAVHFTLEESMAEMRDLIKTAGMEIVGEVTQRLNEPNPRTYVGTGKVGESMEMLQQRGTCTVVFDAELSPGQQKVLENTYNKKLMQNDWNLEGEEGEIKVIDRTALILDIFAQHAKTREGKLQVDLALHEYRKPRLTRMWTHLERQSGAGGVGLRGPGESQLEIDKRLVRDRIIVLKKKIDNVQKQRDLHRRGRANTGLPVLSLVGYTNAGKSTLLNYLTRAGVMAENILFATLDPTTRKVKLPGHKTHPEVLLTDTVGFIQKLPTQLVAAFRATLEEVREADVLVHVIDVSNPMWPKQANAVRTVLAEIGAGDKPMVQLLNKIDLLSAEEAAYCRDEARNMENAVAVSSTTGEGMGDFVKVAEEAMSQLLVPVELLLPYAKGDEMNIIHEVGAVETVEYREAGTYVRGRVPRSVANRLGEFRLDLDADAGVPSGGADGPEADGEVDWTAIGRGRHAARDSPASRGAE